LAPTEERPLEFRIFEIQDGGSRYVENPKKISATVRPIFMKFGTLVQNGSLSRSDR